MGTEQRYLQKENGNTVSDAVAVDLFTEPHHNRRTCGKNKDDYDSREPKFKTAVVKCYLAVEKVEVICSTLNNTKTDCYITSDSTDFASAASPSLANLSRGGIATQRSWMMIELLM